MPEQKNSRVSVADGIARQDGIRLDRDAGVDEPTINVTKRDKFSEVLVRRTPRQVFQPDSATVLVRAEGIRK